MEKETPGLCILLSCQAISVSFSLDGFMSFQISLRLPWAQASYSAECYRFGFIWGFCRLWSIMCFGQQRQGNDAMLFSVQCQEICEVSLSLTQQCFNCVIDVVSAVFFTVKWEEANSWHTNPTQTPCTKTLYPNSAKASCSLRLWPGLTQPPYAPVWKSWRLTKEFIISSSQHLKIGSQPPILRAFI